MSDRSSRDHRYPRPDLSSLASYLTGPHPQRSRPSSPERSTPENESEDHETESFVCLYDISTASQKSFAASPKGLAKLAKHKPTSKPSLVFLRGFASPQWLNVLGELYNPTPEFYRRHLESQALNAESRDYFTSSPLPSASAMVCQLAIPTICTRNVDIAGYEPEDLQSLRVETSATMADYFLSLRNGGQVADSVVRQCLILSKQEYVLEQTVSIEVGRYTDGWRAMVWLDSGKDLSSSPPGPWNPAPGMKPWETYFYPVIVHQAKDLSSLLDQGTHLAPTNHVQPAFKENESWVAAQNISLLPAQYGSTLDKELASRDALYALHELFHFAASAETQVLDLLDKRIAREISFIGVKQVPKWNSVCLLNLRYIKSILTSNARRITSIANIIRNRHSLDWPCDEKSPVAKKAAALLLADYEDLLRRADMLARECEQGMTALANSSVLEESKRSADTGIRVQRLTIIGTVFIPLSFVCSVWGTNFKEFGSGSRPIWMLFASAGPVILLSYLIYHWEAIEQLFHKMIPQRGEVADEES